MYLWEEDPPWVSSFLGLSSATRILGVLAYITSISLPIYIFSFSSHLTLSVICIPHTFSITLTLLGDLVKCSVQYCERYSDEKNHVLENRNFSPNQCSDPQQLHEALKRFTNDVVQRLNRPTNQPKQKQFKVNRSRNDGMSWLSLSPLNRLNA